MSNRTWLPGAAAIGVSLSIVGCGSSLKPVQPAVTPAPARTVAAVEPPRPVAPVDPVAALISQSQQHFVDGERELSDKMYFSFARK